MPFDPDATMRAARILIGQDPGPGDRLDAYLLLAGPRVPLATRRTGGGFRARPCAVYEAVSGRALPIPASPPSFGVVKWRGAERRHEVGVWLAGRFLGWLSSPTRRRCRGRARLAGRRPRPHRARAAARRGSQRAAPFARRCRAARGPSSPLPNILVAAVANDRPVGVSAATPRS